MDTGRADLQATLHHVPNLTRTRPDHSPVLAGQLPG